MRAPLRSAPRWAAGENQRICKEQPSSSRAEPQTSLPGWHSQSTAGIPLRYKRRALEINVLLCRPGRVLTDEVRIRPGCQFSQHVPRSGLLHHLLQLLDNSITFPPLDDPHTLQHGLMGGFRIGLGKWKEIEWGRNGVNRECQILRADTISFFVYFPSLARHSFRRGITRSPFSRL